MSHQRSAPPRKVELSEETVSSVSAPLLESIHTSPVQLLDPTSGSQRDDNLNVPNKPDDIPT